MSIKKVVGKFKSKYEEGEIKKYYSKFDAAKVFMWVAEKVDVDIIDINSRPC